MHFCFLEKDRVLNPEMLNTLRIGHLSLQSIRNKLKIGNKYIADKILIYNNLHDDYAEWVGKMGLPHEASGQLKKIYAKSGVRPQGMDYFSIYSDAAKELVESKNRYEINQFGHKFNN